ncbi:hypothetical protein BS50DRAFT_572170 [Corynespora cassiicola Philippines]|uniref:Uncharacterized protein n=1 Tax=Corynespora cassiicola Philippines TaxID=1448308 RepID=A0A2T2NUC0_CORCC|nr:hypothetical protein BS50DRAFT_572170 [Corynespora cassiicola Philippines]
MTTTYSTCGPPTDNPAATSWVCWLVTETLAHATPAQTLDDGDRIPAQQTGGTDQAISGVQSHTATHNGGAQKTATSIPHFTLSPTESDPPDQAAATSPPSTTASQGSGGSNGVSKGAVAGIAIATAILGGALAFLAAFLLFKRRARPKGSSPYNSTPDLLAYSKSSQSPYISISQTPTATPLPPPNSPPPQGSNDLLASFLPPPADDQTIRSRVAALFAEVQRHVDTFYRDVHASITPTMEADLRQFGTSGEGRVVEMLQGASVPTEVLKRVLAVYILRVVAPEDEGEGEGGTLFPADVVGVKGVGVGSGGREG